MISDLVVLNEHIDTVNPYVLNNLNRNILLYENRKIRQSILI